MCSALVWQHGLLIKMQCIKCVFYFKLFYFFILYYVFVINKLCYAAA